jgi:putative Mg2+ transporter-C (MgtC) family protein
MRIVADVFTLGWGGTLARLAVATALGAVIGLERELDEKAAGLRTHMLVALGSALFTLVSAYGFSEFFGHGRMISFDPSRIAAQIVTGIGFLGAGVIFRSGFTVRGLTTAASLWLVAAVGMAAGAGYWQGAVIGTVIGIVALRPLEWLKKLAYPGHRPSRMTVVLAEGSSGARVMEAVERAGDVLIVRRDGRRLDLEARLERDKRAQTLHDVAVLDEVEEARWEG